MGKVGWWLFFPSDFLSYPFQKQKLTHENVSRSYYLEYYILKDHIWPYIELYGHLVHMMVYTDIYGTSKSGLL